MQGLCKLCPTIVELKTQALTNGMSFSQRHTMRRITVPVEPLFFSCISVANPVLILLTANGGARIMLLHGSFA